MFSAEKCAVRLDMGVVRHMGQHSCNIRQESVIIWWPEGLRVVCGAQSRLRSRTVGGSGRLCRIETMVAGGACTWGGLTGAPEPTWHALDGSAGPVCCRGRAPEGGLGVVTGPWG